MKAMVVAMLEILTVRSESIRLQRRARSGERRGTRRR